MALNKFLAGAVLFVLSGNAAAAGPEIAYAKRASRPEIHLVNPDGTGQRLIYRGASKTVITGLAMKPGGGEISFEEVDSSGQTASLKSVQYGDTGMGTVVRSIPGCRIFSIDYRPVTNDGSFFYVDLCSRTIQFVRPGISGPVNVGQSVSKVAWLNDGETFLFSGINVTKAVLASPFTQTVVAPGLQCVQWMRTGHHSEHALLKIGSACGGGIGYLTVDPPVWTDSIEQGDAPAFSTGDDCFIYITPAQRGGSYLMIRRLDGGGQPFRLGAKGNYSDVTWRRLAAGETGSACPVAAPPN
jgi:hypothetical protein